MRLFHFEIGNAIPQQAADAVTLLEHNHVVANPCKLLRCGHACRAGTNDGDALAGPVFGGLRRDPSHFPAFIDDRVFDRLDADRVVVDVQRASCFAWRRTNAPGELGKIIGRVQGVERLAPILAKNQVIKIRNDVVDRATGLTKRDTAIHAARTLLLGFGIAQMQHKLVIIFHPFRRRN